MIKYFGPKFKLLKNLEISYLPGFYSKYLINSFKNLTKINKKKTNYSYILKEKQKLKFNYNLTDYNLKKYINITKLKKGVLSLNLIKKLEMRLDYTLVKIGFCISINQAKQFINHEYIFVNKILIKLPSYILKSYDIIHIKVKSKSIKTIIKNNLRYFIKLNWNYYFNLYYQICIKNFKFKILRPIYSRESLLKLNNLLLMNTYNKI
uniref:30S ribosomal protein S4 n=1 Tax=Nephromyces sp. ex Molgula occidentalis TaxID=2544991 RepID=A0A5C1H7P8_9APIC|nr:30S ribosomal protein S4 [Nephromyces sp. ex Molgula occidentalis]